MSVELSTDEWIEGEQLSRPKLEIANYVEAQDIRVPKRFDTLKDGLAFVSNGGRIILRSEHPGDYTGASGLASSVEISDDRINQGRKTQEYFGIYRVTNKLIHDSSENAAVSSRDHGGPGYLDVRSMIIADAMEAPHDITFSQLLQVEKLTGQLERYSRLLNQPPGAFLGELDYSYWEYIPGTNITVVADDVLDGQYHMFLASEPDEVKNYPTYDAGVVNAGGEVLRTFDQQGYSTSRHFNPELIQRATQLYESVKNLPKFASKHCPVIEMQMGRDGSLYFLQYHRARDFRTGIDPLKEGDYSSEDGWIKADAIRGAIGDLATVEAALFYPDSYGFMVPLPQHEEASADLGYDVALYDILARRRDVYFGTHGFNRTYANMAAGHGTRVQWFHPQSSLALTEPGFSKLTDERVLTKKMVEYILRQNRMARIALDVASDGNNAFIRRNPDRPEPEITIL